jgi:hypothetical protein
VLPPFDGFFLFWLFLMNLTKTFFKNLILFSCVSPVDLIYEGVTLVHLA